MQPLTDEVFFSPLFLYKMWIFRNVSQTEIQGLPGVLQRVPEQPEHIKDHFKFNILHPLRIKCESVVAILPHLSISALSAGGLHYPVHKKYVYVDVNMIETIYLCDASYTGAH